MVTIKKISLQELDSYVNSKEFVNLQNKPISKARVRSYINNPRAHKNDIVLFMAFKEHQIIGYRTVWADIFYNQEKKVSFGWLSGSWVHPEFRRKGVSTLIFNEVLKDWDYKLMYTNYSETSKLLYDKTTQFKLLYSLTGTRYYIRFSLADILPPKRRIFELTKRFWSFVDEVLNFIFDLRFTFKNQTNNKNIQVKVNEVWNEDIVVFLENFNNNLFKRSEKEFQWIQSFPWILTSEEVKQENKSYFFSCYANQFESDFYTIYNKDQQLISCLMITIRDGHLKIPYSYSTNEYMNEISSFIVDICLQKKVKTIVVYNHELEEKLNQKLFFIKKKTFNQKYFVTNKLSSSILKNTISIQTGDGDVVFT